MRLNMQRCVRSAGVQFVRGSRARPAAATSSGRFRLRKRSTCRFCPLLSSTRGMIRMGYNGQRRREIVPPCGHPHSFSASSQQEVRFPSVRRFIRAFSTLATRPRILNGSPVHLMIQFIDRLHAPTHTLHAGSKSHSRYLHYGLAQRGHFR